ncbi:MAG: PEP-CTERM sorting domain-containing protein [Phycisphaerae bacterium]|nr:PEP-CTERM sorting domain-containing protein [Phycisphaerae bacterium]
MAWEIYNAMAELGYGPALPPPPVPEPATLCVLACGGWLCLRRRKR